MVANLYYCQPLLIQFSDSFGVSYEQVSRIPTLLQAGYAVGIILISPLGDLVRRRGLIILPALVSAFLTVGLAVTPNFVVFEALCFLVGVVSVTPQIMIPLAADLAPPERRAAAMSVIISGLLFGVLLACILAGIIPQFVTWRVIYFVIPDYPAKNSDITYLEILRTMARFAYTEPILIQACLVNLASCACFTNFWVTLTFLLGGAPYHYSTLAIGLFGLMGIFGVALGPLVGRAIDMLIPWYASLIAVLALSCFQANISVAARARLNALFVLSLFIGQIMGTAAGTKVFTTYGWRAAAAFNLGLYAWILVVIMLRGPHCERYTWFGYQGGWEARKSVVEAWKKRAEAEAAAERDGRGGHGDTQCHAH
ncbi:major facilitator superfamily domain-containing protein [Roridomyces roridus]|uniref:Major facilitator superfamily domain-containing protein n=1 Tax=Roridomyces roridus TaxID=1738132 RepID=A0AAD7F9W9_9AGAR|nr:major facilitator superfamily domain-containing protein [Roridomyces roridus]